LRSTLKLVTVIPVCNKKKKEQRISKCQECYKLLTFLPVSENQKESLLV